MRADGDNPLPVPWPCSVPAAQDAAARPWCWLMFVWGAKTPGPFTQSPPQPGSSSLVPLQGVYPISSDLKNVVLFLSVSECLFSRTELDHDG